MFPFHISSVSRVRRISFSSFGRTVLSVKCKCTQKANLWQQSRIPDTWGIFNTHRSFRANKIDPLSAALSLALALCSVLAFIINFRCCMCVECPLCARLPVCLCVCACYCSCRPMEIGLWIFDICPIRIRWQWYDIRWLLFQQFNTLFGRTSTVKSCNVKML